MRSRRIPLPLQIRSSRLSRSRRSIARLCGMRTSTIAGVHPASRFWCCRMSSSSSPRSATGPRFTIAMTSRPPMHPASRRSTPPRTPRAAETPGVPPHRAHYARRGPRRSTVGQMHWAFFLLAPCDAGRLGTRIRHRNRETQYLAILREHAHAADHGESVAATPATRRLHAFGNLLPRRACTVPVILALRVPARGPVVYAASNGHYQTDITRDAADAVVPHERAAVADSACAVGPRRLSGVPVTHHCHGAEDDDRRCLLAMRRLRSRVESRPQPCAAAAVVLKEATAAWRSATRRIRPRGTAITMRSAKRASTRSSAACATTTRRRAGCSMKRAGSRRPPGRPRASAVDADWRVRSHRTFSRACIHERAMNRAAPRRVKVAPRGPIRADAMADLG